MSGPGEYFRETPHRRGTTWEGFAVQWPDTNGVPRNLEGVDARMVWVGETGQVVFDWHLSDPTKPGLSVENPADGVLKVVGPGVLDAPVGTLYYDLKVWWPDGEVSIDIRGEQPIFDGPNPA